jgi:hypothetical protein
LNQLDGWLRQIEGLRRVPNLSNLWLSRGDTISGMIVGVAWTVEILNETVDAELAE